LTMTLWNSAVTPPENEADQNDKELEGKPRLERHH